MGETGRDAAACRGRVGLTRGIETALPLECDVLQRQCFTDVHIHTHQISSEIIQILISTQSTLLVDN